MDFAIHCSRCRAVILAHASPLARSSDLAPFAREIFDVILALNNANYDHFSPKLAQTCAELMRAKATQYARCSTCGRITFAPGDIWYHMRDNLCECNVPRIVDIVSQSIVRAIWTRKWAGNDAIARVLPREKHLLTFAHEVLDDFRALTSDELKVQETHGVSHERTEVRETHGVSHEPSIPLHYLTINCFRYRGFFIEEHHVFRAISGATFAKFLAYMIFGEKRLFGRDMANISLFETDHVLAKIREIRPDVLKIPSIAKLVAAHHNQIGSIFAVCAQVFRS